MFYDFQRHYCPLEYVMKKTYEYFCIDYQILPRLFLKFVNVAVFTMLDLMHPLLFINTNMCFLTKFDLLILVYLHVIVSNWDHFFNFDLITLFYNIDFSSNTCYQVQVLLCTLCINILIY